jgi:putative oxidoreductase
MTGIEPLAYLAARIFTCGSWIASGVHAAMHFEKTVQGITDHGIPLPRLVLPAVLVMEFGGAALVLADQYAWAVCLVWIAFLFLATYFYHRRFVTPEGGIEFIEYVQFWKNVSMIGGLIAIMLLDPSRPDWLLRG